MPDYTKLRSSWKVETCPKCGRKGKVTRWTEGKANPKPHARYTHISKIQVVAGLQFESVLEYCHIVDKESETQ